MAHRSDEELIRATRNTARFFTETRQLSWVLLAATLVWGAYGYRAMPQRKDPEVPIREAAVVCVWPGASPAKIEPLVTRRIEEKIAENPRVERITSSTRTSLTVVRVKLIRGIKDIGKEFDDIQLKLDSIHDLPEGAGPIRFIKDFGDTATLLLTVASPRASDVETRLRADAVRRAIERVRALEAPGRRLALVYGFPNATAMQGVRLAFQRFGHFAQERGAVADVKYFDGPGFAGMDARSDFAEDALLTLGGEYIQEHLRESELHPDAWRPLIVGDLGRVESLVREAASDKYSYRELDDFTDLVKRTLATLPQVSKVTLSGVVPEQVRVEYSQEKFASYGLAPTLLPQILGARNITVPGGVIEVQGKNLRIDPSGEFVSEREIGDVLVPVGRGGVYLRDLALVYRGYQQPRFLNFYVHRDERGGGWRRSRAITLAVQMRSGEQIADFGEAVDAALADLRQRLPDDLIVARTSDQPLQVRENIDLFMRSLGEAVVLVVLVSLLGFWEWRSALLMAFSIPITLAMTFGMMHALGIDLQQVSIASLIIALGLLVDDPVVAGDAIKREMAAGHPGKVAAWLGPTKLATAILFATITNIVAYVPFLALTGETGKFLYSLPVVIGCSLVASRVVSMTFIPLLGYHLLRPRAEPTVEERKRRGFAAWYWRVGARAIENRWKVLVASLACLVIGGVLASRLKTQFFPKDLSYLSYIDVWLPEDAPFSTTNATAAEVEQVVRDVADAYGREHPDTHGRPREVLESITSFVGGGGPRFWFSVPPEQAQINYAQVLVKVKDKHDTNRLVGPLQDALFARIAGAHVDVRQLETGAAVGIPVSVRISGEDVPTLRGLASEMKQALRAVRIAARVRDDWGAESFAVRLQIDPDRANLAGVTNLDVAAASVVGMNGFKVATLRDGEKQIPVVARLRVEDRARLADVQNLYVASAVGAQKVPLGLVSRISYDMETERLQRRNHFRTITVSAFPTEGHLPSEVLKAAFPAIRELQGRLPPGYRVEIGGEYEEQKRGFGELAVVMALSVGMIFLALLVQFRDALKPFIVFAAIPYGTVGAVAALWLMGAPFGFMAFLGVASLVGVIVSHIIVFFDFIEEARERGEPLRDALLHAGILRLRPVLITVGATVIALFPLAANGGPLWEPLCYAQIGGLTVATVVTMGLVPILYAIFVYDLKLVRWEAPHTDPPPTPPGAPR